MAQKCNNTKKTGKWSLADAAEANRRSRAKSLDIGEINVEKAKKKKRRRDCEHSAAQFIETYCTACPGGFLRIPPTEKMRRIIDEMQKTIDGGELYQIMMPRGHGKTSYVKGVTAWAIAFGYAHFVEVVAANGRGAQRMLKDIWNLFSRSPKLKEDFPEICEPIARLEGKTNRCKSITVNGEPTEMRRSADEINLPVVKGSPSSGAIVIAVGFKAAGRGAVSGDSRPDLIIFDDIQDADMAHSEERVDDAMDLIEADFLGTGSHLKSTPAFMTATPIAAGDLTDRIRDSGSWHTSCFKMLQKLPSCVGKPNGEDLWAEYADIRAREVHAKDGKGNPSKKCCEFYEAHREAMDAGAEVLNEKNFIAGKELSAIQHAMNLRIDRGVKVFDAEYQMEPHRTKFTFEVSARMILNRVREGTPMGYTPEGTVLTVCATDINPSYALSTAIVRFDVNRTAFVAGYFVTKCNISDANNDTAYHQKIFNLLAEHGRAIRGLGIPLDMWGVDCGGKQFSPVTKFALQSQALCGLQCIPMAGRAGRTWNPNVRSRIRNALNDTVLCRDPEGRVWMAWNADTHKESAQKAWGTETGAPGGCSIYDGGINHIEFATQIANEKLKAKQQLLDGRVEFLWKTKEPHDFGDCMAMSFALAGSRSISADVGISTAGFVKVTEASPSTAEDSGIEIGCDF